MNYLEKIKEEYIEKLLFNQNVCAEPEQKNLFSKEDYEKMLENAFEIIKNNKDLDIQELRNLIYESSHIEEKVINFILDRKLAPSMSISYGTKNYRETLSIGEVNEKTTSKDTIYDIASVSKLFTSLSIMKLASQSIIDLNEDVTYYLPEFQNLKGVSILQLLTFNVSLITDGRLDDCSYDEATYRLKNIKVNENFDKNKNPYTDMGAMVLKEVVKRVTNDSFFNYVNENIIKKANMKDTHIIVPENKLHRVASTTGNITYNNGFKFREVPLGIVNDGKARVLGQSVNDFAGHAGIFTTSNDMANLAISLLLEEVIDKDNLKKLSINSTGRFIEEISKYRQYLGKLCYCKNPILGDSEVDHPLSSKSIGLGGWTGTQFTLDPLNNVYFFMGANRSKDRVVALGKAKEELPEGTFYTDEKGLELINIDGKKFVNSTKFAWDRDDFVVHPALRLSLCYDFLEYAIEKMYNIKFVDEDYKKKDRII